MKKKIDLWPLKITVAAFLISVIMAVLTNGFIKDVNIFLAVAILIVVIFLGVLFDIIGLAITISDETPFHSRSTRGYKGSKEAIKLIRSAGKVSSFCNDVIGDIAGVLSGGLAASVATGIYMSYSVIPATIINMLITAFVAALTVGGKAVGKNIAKNNSEKILMKISILIYWSKRFFSFGKGKRVR